MHSTMVRANALLTFAGTTLMFMALGAMVTDMFHESSPEVNISIKSVERLYNLPSGNDEAYIVMDLYADLRSVFSWNTKQLFVFVNVEYETPKNHLNQVVVFDRIIEKRDNAVISNKNLRNKYNLVDQGKNLRGEERQPHRHVERDAGGWGAVHPQQIIPGHATVGLYHGSKVQVLK